MSEAEQLPDGWKSVRLADIGDFKSGSGFPLTFQGNEAGDYPFFKVSDFSNPGNEQALIRANHYISEGVRKRISARIFPRGTIAFAKIGAAIFLERKRATAQDSCLDNNMAGFILSDLAHSRQLILFNFRDFALGDLVSSTALPAISSTDLKGIQFALPEDSEEQKAIAQALSDMDDLIASLDALIAKKRDIKRGAMQQLLTGKRRLPGFSGEWTTFKIGQIFDFLRNGSHARAAFRDNGEVHCAHYGAIHAAPTSHVTPAVFPRLPASAATQLPLVQNCDLLLADASEDLDGIGKSVEITDCEGQKLVAGLHTVLMRPKANAVAPGYGGYLQFTADFKGGLIRIANGISVYGVSKNALREVEIKLPGYDEQIEIAAILLDLQAEIAPLEAKRGKLEDIRRAMMQQLLTGRIRLK